MCLRTMGPFFGSTRSLSPRAMRVICSDPSAVCPAVWRRQSAGAGTRELRQGGAVWESSRPCVEPKSVHYAVVREQHALSAHPDALGAIAGRRPRKGSLSRRQRLRQRAVLLVRPSLSRAAFQCPAHHHHLAAGIDADQKAAFPQTVSQTLLAHREALGRSHAWAT